MVSLFLVTLKKIKVYCPFNVLMLFSLLVFVYYFSRVLINTDANV